MCNLLTLLNCSHKTRYISAGEFDVTNKQLCIAYNSKALDLVCRGYCVITLLESGNEETGVLDTVEMMVKKPYFEEASSATKAFLMLCYRWNNRKPDGIPIVKDIAKMIGKMVFASAGDPIWKRDSVEVENSNASESGSSKRQKIVE